MTTIVGTLGWEENKKTSEVEPVVAIVGDKYVVEEGEDGSVVLYESKLILGDFYCMAWTGISIEEREKSSLLNSFELYLEQKNPFVYCRSLFGDKITQDALPEEFRFDKEAKKQLATFFDGKTKEENEMDKFIRSLRESQTDKIKGGVYSFLERIAGATAHPVERAVKRGYFEEINLLLRSYCIRDYDPAGAMEFILASNRPVVQEKPKIHLYKTTICGDLLPPNPQRPFDYVAGGSGRTHCNNYVIKTEYLKDRKISSENLKSLTEPPFITGKAAHAVSVCMVHKAAENDEHTRKDTDSALVRKDGSYYHKDSQQTWDNAHKIAIGQTYHSMERYSSKKKR